MLNTTIIAIFLLLIILRYIILKFKNLKKIDRKYVSTMIVLGSGGHTTEMIEIVKNLNKDIFIPQVFVIANTDLTSEKRITCFNNITIDRIPRSREVKQSYITSIYTTFISIIYSLRVVWKHKPDLILCNGPGTCIPICFWGYILKMLLITSSKIVYVESICRVKSLSLSGLIIYYTRIYEALFVHWPELQVKYPKTKLKFLK